MESQSCLCLTGKTIEENLRLLDECRSEIDICELRVDCLEAQERFHIRSFPEKAGIPVILTVRRRSDGGEFDSGEAVRLVILAKGLAFASTDRRKNFAYVEIDHDLEVHTIEEAARTFGTKVIRSRYFMDGMPEKFERQWRELSSNNGDIPKIHLASKSIKDVEALFRFFSDRNDEDPRIVDASGDHAFCIKLLGKWLGSFLSYFHSEKAEGGLQDGLSLEQYFSVYQGKNPGLDWDIYGLLGGSTVLSSLSPSIHNRGFQSLGLKSLYLPFPADNLDSFLALAEILKIRGLSVTVPMKEQIMAHLAEKSREVEEIGACNTILARPNGWHGCNTDADGFAEAVLDFTGRKNLKRVRACIIGAGGAAKAVASALYSLGAKACVINRDMSKARSLAEHYRMPWSDMTPRAIDLLDKYNDLIIQTTSVGMNGGSPGDPIAWYNFKGKEALFETIYNPAETELLKRARSAGCKTTNGLGMLHAQAAIQFRHFTGTEYPVEGIHGK